MQGAVQEPTLVAAVGVTGAATVPMFANHFRTCRTEADPLLSTKATKVPSRDKTGDVVTLPPDKVVTLYAQ
jgi:hypothetical protein